MRATDELGTRSGQIDGGTRAGHGPHRDAPSVGERIPDEFEVTGVWIEFHDLGLVVVEERAEHVPQLGILGRELRHIRQGHHPRHVDATAAAARTLAGGTDWPAIALTVAASDSHAADEAEAEEFGVRLASALRGRLDPCGGPEGTPVDPVGMAIHASLGAFADRRTDS
ncbi:hypothetical protein ACIP79_42255 [Streptomyces sp. NPDC088747]|uniref:hypothetical protein n=1 Tax=Streptomyces sp. NPDC088747 TaxID=3365886 RepID=UPI00381E5226